MSSETAVRVEDKLYQNRYQVDAARISRLQVLDAHLVDLIAAQGGADGRQAGVVTLGGTFQLLGCQGSGLQQAGVIVLSQTAQEGRLRHQEDTGHDSLHR